MYRLYYYPGNANLAPHVLLEETGAQYELVLVDRETRGQKDAAYVRLNPNGRIPTLVDGELVIFEAAAICLHIAPAAAIDFSPPTDDYAYRPIDSANGYSHDYPLARHLACAKMAHYIDGTTEIQNVVIARDLLRRVG